MESREITRDEIVQVLANRITRAGKRYAWEASIPDLIEAERRAYRAVARDFGLERALEDALYLMEEGPE